MKRYCETIIQKIRPCDVGSAAYDSSGMRKSCFDEPMEKNCNNMVNENEQCCPTCGKKFCNKEA